MACLEVDQKIDLVRRLREESCKNDMRLRTGCRDYDETAETKTNENEPIKKQFLTLKRRIIISIFMFGIVSLGYVQNTKELKSQISTLQQTVSKEMIDFNSIDFINQIYYTLMDV
ncbi:MAG: hypothetical protein GX567_17850 [Clostridia bacterium]|nr:hypothetical protein [Clostridia bacterium]